MMTITAHCLVKNEARFLWFSVMSVIDYVDRVLLWDTGSTDRTLEIIKEIKRIRGDKVDFREAGKIDINEFTNVRQQMLDSTNTDWFIVVDGDEVWWEDSIKMLVEVIGNKGKEIDAIVVPTFNLIGDIYHYQEKQAGQYHLAGKVGHYNLRAVNRRIPGLHSKNPHGTWGWADEENKMIQERDHKKILFVDAPYLHATHLPRSGQESKEKDVPKRKMKQKYELGIPFPREFYYPEVFFRPRPVIIPSPWKKRNVAYILRAAVETPFKKLRRRIMEAPVGY